MQENELVPFTFKSTGKTVMIKKVSPFLAMELQNAFPPPEPPTQKVEYDEGDVREEKNWSHPDYLKQVEAYNLAFSNKVQNLMIKRGVHFEITEEIRTELEELRKFWQEEYGTELSEKNDKLAYVLYVCAGTQEDTEDMIAAITKRSQPTEVAIQQAQGTFQR